MKFEFTWSYYCKPKGYDYEMTHVQYAPTITSRFHSDITENNQCHNIQIKTCKENESLLNPINI